MCVMTQQGVFTSSGGGKGVIACVYTTLFHVCMNDTSFHVFRDSIRVCHDSLDVCHDSLNQRVDSLYVCHDSLHVCHNSSGCCCVEWRW